MARIERIRGILTWIGLILLIVGAKLWLINTTGSSLPILDQIDGEGEVVLRPWLEGWLHPHNFWHPHNEHRIVFTKLVAWGLVAINGQWDAYVEMFVNAFLHALLLPVILSWLKPHVSRGAFAALAISGTVLWLLPIDWENTLQGFQNQFYFLIWFAFLQCRWVLSEERFGWRWWAGNLCGLAALVSMGSGLLASLAVAITVGLEAARNRRWTRWHAFTLGSSLTSVVVGLLIRTTVAGHDPLKADGVGQLLRKIWLVTAWPYSSWFGMSSALAFVLPVAAVLFIKKGLSTAFSRTYLALFGWIALIMLATAYYRANGAVLSPRYFDQYYIALLLQGIAFALIPQRWWRRGLLAAWIIALGVALAGQTRHALKGSIEGRAAKMAQQEDHLRAYFASGDPSALTSVPLRELPYPSAEVLVDRWQHESIRSIMPAAVRKPVDIPAVEDAADLASLPPAPYPVIAVSPRGKQNEPWIWRSERQPATTLPVLRFRFSGEWGDPRAALTMRVVSDAWAMEVHPDGSAPHRWKTINVVRPPGEWWIEIADRDSAARIALTAPVELGWFSWSVEKALKYHRWWIGTGAVLLLASGLALVPSRRRLSSSA